jgi:hypothetical protein
MFKQKKKQEEKRSVSQTSSSSTSQRESTHPRKELRSLPSLYWNGTTPVFYKQEMDGEKQN